VLQLSRQAKESPQLRAVRPREQQTLRL